MGIRKVAEFKLLDVFKINGIKYGIAWFKNRSSVQLKALEPVSGQPSLIITPIRELRIGIKNGSIIKGPFSRFRDEILEINKQILELATLFHNNRERALALSMPGEFLKVVKLEIEDLRKETTELRKKLNDEIRSKEHWLEKPQERKLIK